MLCLVNTNSLPTEHTDDPIFHLTNLKVRFVYHSKALKNQRFVCPYGLKIGRVGKSIFFFSSSSSFFLFSFSFFFFFFKSGQKKCIIIHVCAFLDIAQELV